eukprot:351412-Amphidinium_carterae.1
MPTMSLRTGPTIQRGINGTATTTTQIKGADHQQYAEQQPVQHIGLFGVSSGSGPLPVYNV